MAFDFGLVMEKQILELFVEPKGGTKMKWLVTLQMQRDSPMSLSRRVWHWRMVALSFRYPPHLAAKTGARLSHKIRELFFFFFQSV